MNFNQLNIDLKFQIENRFIGNSEPCFIIAEAGVNHNGDIKLAKKLIETANESGADAIKFQTFFPEEGITKDAPLAKYQSLKTPFRNQLDMIKRLQLSENDFSELKDYAENLDLVFLSTPFDMKSIELLNNLKISAFKISSGDITNKQLLEKAAEYNKPIILSTGMSDIDEIQDAINWITNKGCKSYSLMQCTSNYPTEIHDCNLLAIRTLSEKFNVPIGFSDHTTDSVAAILAIGLGASYIEKHITLDHKMSGPDHHMSLEPKELKIFVNYVRKAQEALGDGIKKCLPCEEDVKKVARKSVVTLRNIHKDEIIEKNDLGVKRPGMGLPPKNLDNLIGKKAKRNILAETLIEKNDFY